MVTALASTPDLALAGQVAAPIERLPTSIRRAILAALVTAPFAVATRRRGPGEVSP